MWTEPRATFHGRYFHVEDAILEPKPVQKPRPPVMIAGGGEQLEASKNRVFCAG
jgi:alkanesulfonate monooxygenase SsuD/methylene tetrahydromethanopterin reductase-like flavin-dependent oxidoreductase (luciferase family)